MEATPTNTGYDNFKRSDADESFVKRVVDTFRQRIVLETEKNSAVVEGKVHRILEVGCGMGQELFAVRRELKQLAAAAGAPQGLQEDRHHVEFVALDMNPSIEAQEAFQREAEMDIVNHTLPAELPFGSASEADCFDLIMARLSLHYFDESVLREQVIPDLKRVLDSGHGVLVFVVKTADNNFATGKVILSERVWTSILEGAGFKVFKSERSMPTETPEQEQLWISRGKPWAFEAGLGA